MELPGLVCGLFALRDWRVELVVRPLRWLETAATRGGLAGYASRQLFLNLQVAAREDQRDTWLGALRLAIAKVVPSWAQVDFVLHRAQGGPA